MASCKAGVEVPYTALVNDETDFTYTTKSQRRDSGDGLSFGADRSMSRRGNEVAALEQPRNQSMDGRGRDEVNADAEAKEQAALEKEATDAGKRPRPWAFSRGSPTSCPAQRRARSRPRRAVRKKTRLYPRMSLGGRCVQVKCQINIEM